MLELTLSEKDYQQILAAKEHGALESLEGHKIPAENGTIVFPCSDGDKFDDLYTQHKKVCSLKREQPRHHQFALNGGALLISPSAPILDAEKDSETFVRHAKKAVKGKGIFTIIFYTHLPCLVATETEMSFLEQMKHLLEAKIFFQGIQEFAECDMCCFVHVDYAPFEDKMATYFVNKKKMIEFLEGQDIVLRAA